MTPEVHTALVRLRREIDILSASILARHSLAAPEILSPQRISIGSDRAVVQTMDPPAVAASPAKPLARISAAPSLEENDRIAYAESATTRNGFLQRLMALARRILRALRPSP